jgi:tetratricopeptide (TPR) repeat protein
MFREGRYDNAINYYRDGLERFDKLDVHYECARVHNRIGECYKLKGDYTKSLGYIKKCIEVAERIGAARILGYGFTNGGEVYARIGDAKRAIAYIESAEKLFRRLEDVFGQALVQGAYGCAYRAQGDLGTAIEYLSKSLDMLETKVHMPFWIAYVSYELSTIYREREDTLRAKLLLEKAVKIYEEMGNEFWVDKCKEELSVTK